MCYVMLPADRGTLSNAMICLSVCMAALDRKRCILWLHLQLRLQSCQIINDFDQIHCTLKPTQIETRPECGYQPHLLVANNKNNTAAFVWQLGFSWCRLSTYACTITITVGIQITKQVGGVAQW